MRSIRDGKIERGSGSIRSSGELPSRQFRPLLWPMGLKIPTNKKLKKAQ